MLTWFELRGAENFKPDIVVKLRNSSNTYVLDFGVAWETSDYILPGVENLKRDLYSPIKSEVFDLVRRAGIILSDTSLYMCYGIIFGARTAQFQSTARVFDFSKSQIKQLCELAIVGSIKIWRFS